MDIHAIEYAKANPNMPLYMKTSYGKAYIKITFKQLESYKKGWELFV